MGTVETRSKTLARGSGPAAEPAKPKVPEGKPLKESIDCSVGSASGPEGTLENGISASLNGKEDFDGDLGGRLIEVVKTRVVETEVPFEKGFGGRDINVSSEEEDGLEESEMRGVSSLLKMKGSMRKIEVEDGSESESEGEEHDGSLSENGGDLDGKIEAIEVPIEDMSESEDKKEEEEMIDEGYGFSVGDFVWGKIRSHPWWPGQVYDPSNASDYAAKLKVRDWLLVAYFGDGTFAWCQPSQLKHFEENFEEMSRQSNSKSFVYAVQRAVDEIGRLLELEMTCSCVMKENGNGLDRPLVVNAGIKDGVLVPEFRIGKLSNILSEPVDLLAEMKHTAQTISIHSALGLGVLKSRLAAFYHANGDYPLPMYHEPQPILGLEDILNRRVVDVRNTVEVPIQGPFAEEWISSPVSPKLGQTGQTTMQKCPGNSEDRLYQRRKQKSIAEIMEGNIDAWAKSKDVDVAKESKDGDLATEGVNSAKSPPSSGRKKRKGSDQTDGHGGNDVTSATGTLRKVRMLGPLSDSKVPSVENDCSGGKEETRKSPSSGRRKKNEGVSIEVDYGRGKELTNDKPVSTKKVLNRGKVQSSDGKAIGQIEKGSLSRERKKSKYLSPPFTSLIKGQKKKEIETEPLEVSSEARFGERMTRAVGQLAGSATIRKCNDKTFQKELSQELYLRREPSDTSSPQTPKQNPIINPLKVKESANEVLSEVRCAALNPLYPMENKSREMVGGFLSILRSSVYRDGSNSKAFKKRQSGRKRKNLDSEPVSLGKDRNNTNHKSTGHGSKQRTRKKIKEPESHEAKPKGAAEKQGTGKKNKEAESHETKPKGAAEKPDARRKNKAELHEAKPKRAAENPDAKLDKSKQTAGTPDNTDGKGSTTVLLVTFGPGSCLPSKADLVRIYCKFGVLNEAEMFSKNLCARVAFVRSSDAEEAFNHSLHTSPFKAASVTFDLQYPSAALKTRELREIALPKASPPPSIHGKTPEKPSASQQSQLDFLRQKLEMMNLMLENSEGKVSLELKCKLESEIKGLLQSVSTMVGSSST